MVYPGWTYMDGYTMALGSYRALYYQSGSSYQSGLIYPVWPHLSSLAMFYSVWPCSTQFGHVPYALVHVT